MLPATVVWLLGVIGLSILFRRLRGKPIIPRAPANALFAESWRSGRSLSNWLGRVFGGARNCLLVYVADGAVTIVPQCPFNLMFLPEVYGLEGRVPLGGATCEVKQGVFRTMLWLHFDGQPRFELHLRNPQAFQRAVEGR